MRRRIVTALSVVSLILCVAIGLLWVRSLGCCGAAYWIGPERFAEVSSTDGVLGILLTRDSGLRPPVGGTDRLYGWFAWQQRIPPGRDRASLTTPSFNRWGFGLHIGKTGGQPRGWWRYGGRTLLIIYVPYWLPVLAFAPFPLLSLHRFLLRRHRVHSGLCLVCGYDLRASPERCPECGTPVPAKVQAAPP